jgi:SAM-dependent methyltransferase
MAPHDVRTPDQIAAIRANWDARVPIHLNSEFYGVRSGKDSASWFADYEWHDLGPLDGRDVLHLQCHLGTETVEFARRGARTVGLDISGRSIDAAREVALAADVEVEYLCADVLDAPTALDGRRFDIVYTGKGALCYLPDLDRWAQLVRELLRPGGQLYVVEFHPILHALGTSARETDNGELVLRRDYLSGRGAQCRESSRTYTDGPALTEATTCYEWAHGLAEVITAGLRAEFRVESLRECDRAPYRRWQHMRPVGPGWWCLPDDAPRIPLFYALSLRAPDG